MSRRTFVALCSLPIILIAACRRDEPPRPEASAAPARVETATVAAAPRNLAIAKVDVTIPLIPSAVSKCMVGAKGVGKKAFAPGEPIELTLDLKEAPDGLKVAARLIDDEDQVVAHVSEPAAGKKSVTVVIRRELERGTYRLESYWGGNIVCEQTIEVATPR